jgi:hypothetical protein
MKLLTFGIARVSRTVTSRGISLAYEDGARQRQGFAWSRVRCRPEAFFSGSRRATFFSKYSYNFCWPVRTLKAKGGVAQTPAMMAKLTDHVWTLAEWVKRPAVQLA